MSLIPFAFYYMILPCPDNPFTNWQTQMVNISLLQTMLKWTPWHRLLCVNCFLCEILFSFPFLSIFLFVRVIFPITLHALKGKMFKQTQLKMRICCFILSITNMYLVFTRIYHLSRHEGKNDFFPPLERGLIIISKRTWLHILPRKICK